MVEFVRDYRRTYREFVELDLGNRGALRKLTLNRAVKSPAPPVLPSAPAYVTRSRRNLLPSMPKDPTIVTPRWRITIRDSVKNMREGALPKKDLLMNATFGSRVAEDEGEGLLSYFVETEQWRKLIAGDVDIVYGAKGAGKSALYSLLIGQKETLRLGRRIVFLVVRHNHRIPYWRGLCNDAGCARGSASK